MIQHITIEIDKNSLKRSPTLFFFILRNLIKYTINYGTIVLIILLELILGALCSDMVLSISFLFFAIYILIALEETYHVIMIIFLGKQETITHIDITQVKIGPMNFIGGVCVCYNGMFRKSDLFYISLAGPIMPLFYLCILNILFLVINTYSSINILPILKSLTCSMCAPLLALLPLKTQNYASDGYRILHFIKTNNLSIKQTIQAITYTIKIMFFTTVHSSKI